MSACIEWTGAINGRGYGNLRVGDRTVSAHRHVYEIQVGPIPDGMVICHRCDNRRCVNPEHLFAATQLDNIADRDAKGRQARGTTNARARLTALEARAIYALARHGESLRAIARAFGVRHTTVRLIARGETWAHVTGATP